MFNYVRNVQQCAGLSTLLRLEEQFQLSAGNIMFSSGQSVFLKYSSRLPTWGICLHRRSWNYFHLTALLIGLLCLSPHFIHVPYFYIGACLLWPYQMKKTTSKHGKKNIYIVHYVTFEGFCFSLCCHNWLGRRQRYWYN